MANKSTSSAAVLRLGRCLTSEIFELTTGDSRFFVNKDILTSQSKPFEEATRGPWVEATDRKINLNDWESDTVRRLVEFLYIGDYGYPDPSPLNPSPASEASEPAQPNLKDPEPELDICRPLTPLGQCLQNSLPPGQDDSITDSGRLANFDPDKFDFEEVLLAHAMVYALAHYKSVEALKTLALKRLLLVLTKLNPIERASHISMNLVSFASYVYDNTDSLTHSQEPLRRLTSQFLALNLAAFQTEPRAVELVGKGGDLVKDLMGKICRRIPDPEGGLSVEARPKKGYISNIKVVYGNIATPPPDYIREVHGLSSNISIPYNDPYTIWLVPEYTNIVINACTSFNVSLVAGGHAASNNLDRTHNTHRYLDAVKDKAIPEKITQVVLLRDSGTTTTTNGVGLDLKLVKGYYGMSADIRNKGSHMPLYLFWKSVKTRPA